MAGKFVSEQSNDAITLGLFVQEHTPADEDLPLNVKCVYFDADGTVDVKNPDGSAVTGHPVSALQPLWFVPARVTAMTGPSKCYLVMG